MPYSWTPTSERQMLLVAITKANLRPTSETWAAVALELGNGLTPSAVSQKYYKLRNDSAADGKSATSSSQTTPKKRKRKSNGDAQTVRGECEENDDLAVITAGPQLLIADRPFHKVHRDEVDANERNAAQVTPSKKQMVKCEDVDDDYPQSKGDLAT